MTNNPPKHQAIPKGQISWDLAAPPEWEVVQRSVTESRRRDAAAWTTLAGCSSIEIYTDGSAPIRNPGGDLGFAAVFVGWLTPIDREQTQRPAPHAHVEVGGYVPARSTEPPTSNNRAEVAGVLTALEGLREVSTPAHHSAQARILSDSEYTVSCAMGRWQRRKNTDLWPILDQLMEAVGGWATGGVAIEWVRGHAGNLYNEAADELSTRAAFDFDDARYARYRAAQAASGQEMPGAAILAQYGVTAPTIPAPLPPIQPATTASPTIVPGPAASDTLHPIVDGTDYTLILHTRLQGTGPIKTALGRYRLLTRSGRSHLAEVTPTEVQAVDEAEYHTLIAALTDLAGRITTAGRDPARFTLSIYSQQELVIKQLSGVYRVKAAALQTPYRAAQGLLRRFRQVDLIWKRSDELKELIKR